MNMSGHKRATVTISQEEYRRLYEAEQRNYFDLLAIPDDIASQSRLEQESQITRVYDELVSRQKKYEQFLKLMDERIQEVELTTAQQLLDTQADVFSHFINESEGWFLETHKKIEQYQQEFSQRIESEHARFKHEFLKHQKALQKIEDFKHSTQQLALDWINNTQDLIHFIDREYPPEIVDLTIETSMLQQAIENFQKGLFESCIALCQSTFYQLSRQRVQAEKKINLLQTLTLTVEQSFNLLIERINSNRYVQAIDQEGNFLETTIDVDFWSSGKLSELLNEVQNVYTEIQHHPYSLSENNLAEILEKRTPEWSSLLVEIVHEARRTALNAQIRYSLAHLILESALTQGYRPVAGEYEEKDYRKAYIARAIGIDGSEIRIKIDPLENLSFSMSLENNPGSHISEAEMKQRMMELIHSVSQSGFDLGKIEAVQLRTEPTEEEFAKPIRVRQSVSR
ncbi:hypothetical protein ATHL_02119 [Anaerolinea thermolimosa]|nr:hypothetical protein ATHL_02119 [Anaerolinea thermolimosa]